MGLRTDPATGDQVLYDSNGQEIGRYDMDSGTWEDAARLPKQIGGTVLVDHPDFMEQAEPAQAAHDWAASREHATEIRMSRNLNYGPLTVSESEFQVSGRGSADTYRGSFVEDLVIDASRIRVEGVIGYAVSNSEGIRIDGGFTQQLNNVGAASDDLGNGGSGDVLVQGATAAAIVGGSRMNVTLDADSSKCLVDNLIRSSVTDNGTENQVGIVTPP